MSDKKEEELDKVSLAVASTISKSSTFTKFSSNSLMNQKSSIGGFQRVVPKFTGSALGYSRSGDPSVLAWASRVQDSSLGYSALSGIEGNKEEILALMETKLASQKFKLDRAHAVDIKNIKKVVIHESIEFLKRNCH